jgi:DGQHR domain-containing protein
MEKKKMNATVAVSANVVTCDAVMGFQNGTHIFTGLMPAKDLITITTVDHFSSSLPVDAPNQGYQRPPERSRITKLGRHLIDAIVHNEGESGGLFPTAVILASRQPLKYSNGKIIVTSPLQLIDGQHRIEGLRYAIIEKGVEELGDLLVPFVVVEISDRIVEMNQFTIINGNAKSVRTDLVNSILTATVAKRGDSAIDERDRWKVAVTKVVDKLDKTSSSPWHNLILMPDEAGSPKAKNGKVVRATSFMTSIKPIYTWLQEFGMLGGCKDLDAEAAKMYEVLCPYWEALQAVVPDAFVDANESVIQKTPGLFSLHKLLSGYLLSAMFQGHQQWTKDNFVKFLEISPEITDAHFWHKDANRASAYGSMKGFDDLYQLLKESVIPKA